MISVRSKAPDFTLKDQNNKSVKLSSLRGKKVLLSFRPLAWTAVCQDQMKSLEQNHLTLDELNAVALGIGVDSDCKSGAHHFEAIPTPRFEFQHPNSLIVRAQLKASCRS